jgi:DNA-binding MarR family transcriptional regulator
MKTANKRTSAAPEAPLIDIDLESFIPAMLTIVINRLGSTATRTFKRRLDIGLLDVRVLSIVSLHPGASGARIAEVLYLDKGAVSRTLRSLNRRRLVSIAAGENTTRTATLTPTGRALYARAVELLRMRERLLLAEFSPADRAMLGLFLRRLLAAMPALAELANSDAIQE